MVEEMMAVSEGSPRAVARRPGRKGSREEALSPQRGPQGETLRPVTQSGASRKPRLGGTLGKP